MLDVPCIICSRGNNFKKHLDAPELRTGEIFTFFECKYCSVKRTLPVPDDLLPYYQNEDGYRMRKKPGMFHTFLRQVLLEKEVSRIIRKINVTYFLDVGCGAGDFSKFLYEKGYSVSAVDAFKDTPYFLSGTQIPYYQINYERCELIDFHGGRNTVILRHVLEHIRDPRAFVQRLIGYGADSFYIVVPDTNCLQSKLLGRYNYFLDPPAHLWHFNEKSLKIFFNSLDIEVLDCGHDTIPGLVPSLYRFLRIKHAPQFIYRCFEPKSSVTAFSLPLDWLIPNNVIWFIVRKKRTH